MTHPLDTETEWCIRALEQLAYEAAPTSEDAPRCIDPQLVRVTAHMRLLATEVVKAEARVFRIVLDALELKRREAADLNDKKAFWSARFWEEAIAFVSELQTKGGDASAADLRSTGGRVAQESSGGRMGGPGIDPETERHIENIDCIAPVTPRESAAHAAAAHMRKLAEDAATDRSELADTRRMLAEVASERDTAIAERDRLAEENVQLKAASSDMRVRMRAAADELRDERDASQRELERLREAMRWAAGHGEVILLADAWCIDTLNLHGDAKEPFGDDPDAALIRLHERYK